MSRPSNKAMGSPSWEWIELLLCTSPQQRSHNAEMAEISIPSPFEAEDFNVSPLGQAKPPVTMSPRLSGTLVQKDMVQYCAGFGQNKAHTVEV